MKLTRDLRKAINDAVRQNTKGACPGASLGYRHADAMQTTANALLWPVDSDLFDYTPLAEVTTIDDDPANPGCVELDLYVYTGTGYRRELETNVGVLIRDGRVLFASNDGRTVTRKKADLGFPLCPWDRV